MCPEGMKKKINQTRVYKVGTSFDFVVMKIKRISMLLHCSDKAIQNPK